MFRRIDPSPPSGTQPRSSDRARRESRFRLEPLEDRLLLSADLLGVAAWQDADGSVDESEVPVLCEREAETSSDANAGAEESPSIHWGGDADSEVQQVRSFLDQLGVTYPVVIADEVSLAHTAYGVESLPASILVDPDGSVITFGAGVRGTRRLLRQAEEHAAK